MNPLDTMKEPSLDALMGNLPCNSFKDAHSLLAFIEQVVKHYIDRHLTDAQKVAFKDSDYWKGFEAVGKWLKNDQTPLPPLGLTPERMVPPINAKVYQLVEACKIYNAIRDKEPDEWIGDDKTFRKLHSTVTGIPKSCRGGRTEVGGRTDVDYQHELAREYWPESPDLRPWQV
jgi:hypothetical protein